MRFKDADALLKDNKNDYIITKELSAGVGSLALRCGRMRAVVNAMLIATKHIDFTAAKLTEAEPASATAGSIEWLAFFTNN